MDIYTFENFAEAMTQKRMEILYNKARGFFLKDFEENYKNFLTKTLKEHPNFKYFSQGSIHDITNNAQLSYVDYSSKIIESDYISDTMTDEEKTTALEKFKKDKSDAEKKEFNIKKQLFLYVLNGNNPYRPKDDEVWGNLKTKFNLEPLRNQLLKDVFAKGKKVNSDINLFTYFEANNNPNKKKDFIMLVYIEKRVKNDGAEDTKKPKARKSFKAREMNDEEFEARAEVNLNAGNKKSYAKIAHDAKDKPQPFESKKFKVDSKKSQKSSISKEEEHESDDETSFLSK